MDVVIISGLDTVAEATFMTEVSLQTLLLLLHLQAMIFGLLNGERISFYDIL